MATPKTKPKQNIDISSHDLNESKGQVEIPDFYSIRNAIVQLT